MPSMSEIVAEHTDLSETDHWHLLLLITEWQLLADLSFSDLVLWVADRDPNVFWAAAQLRPTTGPTSLFDDVVGDLIAYSPEHLVSSAFMTGSITKTSVGRLEAGLPVDTHAIPVMKGERVIAVIEQHTSMLGVRTSSSMEQAYLATAAQLARMVSVGSFPIPGDDTVLVFNPRVGDGFIRIDGAGEVEYASPNALSAYRRLGLIGDLVDENLARVTSEFFPAGREAILDSVQSVLSGRSARRAEFVSGEAHLMVRVLPLFEFEVDETDVDPRGGEQTMAVPGTRTGAMVLCRDVSDLRSKERELVTKDATIREIHHRVKNNLQTVAALLRMQARRIDSAAARVALTDAVSRVASIAIVHETLSQTFDEIVEFDRVVDGLLRMVGEVAASWGGVSARRQGSFGLVSADMATSLAMVITELCQNAVEHGFADVSGQVLVLPTRMGQILRVEISDNGRGLPVEFDWRDSRSLGLSIVNTLVAEMEGTFTLGPQADGPGTRAQVDVPLTRINPSVQQSLKPSNR